MNLVPVFPPLVPGTREQDSFGVRVALVTEYWDADPGPRTRRPHPQADPASSPLAHQPTRERPTP